MSVRVWASGRVRVRASAMLRGHKKVGYARSGDHVVLHESLCCELQLLQCDLSWLALLYVYCNV